VGSDTPRLPPRTARSELELHAEVDHEAPPGNMLGALAALLLDLAAAEWRRPTANGTPPRQGEARLDRAG
jgi:hypothetical protein